MTDQRNKDEKCNVIILTSGLTGSSVLTGLISRAGFWTGDTHKKEDYDTFENIQLIELNRALFRSAHITGNYLTEFSPEAIERVSSLSGSMDRSPYSAFVQECNRHSPWVWKDPRLWLTIRFWEDLLPLEKCRFIVLTRGYLQCWTSATLRRQIRSYRDLKEYEKNVKTSALTFLKQHGLPYLELGYEELIVDPGASIEKLNSFLGSRLAVEDLKAVYHKPLFVAPRSSWIDLCKAGLIYLKNYDQRVDAQSGRV